LVDQIDAQEVDSPPPALTFRAVAVGSAMCALIGFLGPYWNLYLHSSSLFLDYSVAGAVFFLLLLVILGNGFLGWLWPRLILTPHELVVVTAMMLVAGAITTMGLASYLAANTTAPYYLATHNNDWNHILWPHLASWASPLDPGGKTVAISKFFMGIGPDEPIPWRPWIRPMLLWGVLVGGLYACMTSLMAIMRKQWVEHEHLSFPIAQVPGELCAASASPWRQPSILVSFAFWAGFAVPFAVGCLNALHNYFPRVPGITISRTITDLAPITIWLYLSFAMIGFTFLIPNRVAFSLWFLQVVSFAVRCYMKTYGLEMQENLAAYGASSYPIMAHQAMGGMLVFIGTGMWFSRQHLKRVLACALGYGHRGYDSGEPSSYRMALILLCAGFVTMVVWIWQAGLPLRYSVAFVLAALLIFYGLTRVVAQCGLAVTIAPLIPPGFMTSTVGSANLTADGVGALAVSWTWCSDIRTTVMSSAAHGMKLASRRGRHLLWALLLAAGITFAVAMVMTIYLGYRNGAANLGQWYFVLGPEYLYTWAAGHISQGTAPNLTGYLWTGVGAAIMGLLILAQRSLFWWPIHPVGFLMCSVFWTDVLWLSIFLAWLIKLIIVQFGGVRGYRGARRFFLGMILGQFSVAGFWCIIDTVTQKVGNSVFWI